MCEYLGCTDDVNSISTCCENKYCRKHEGDLCTNCEDYTVCSSCSECHLCIDCNNVVCSKCIEQSQQVINEWLNVDLKCSTCKKLVCRKCVRFCYDCMNQDYNGKVYCSADCPATIKYIDCKLHKWSTCSLHHSTKDQEIQNQDQKFNGCGTCYANWNYSLKYR